MGGNGSYTIGFSGQYVEIGFNCPAAGALAEFLCRDLLARSETQPRVRYDILVVGRQPKVSLWHGDKRLYFGESKYKLAYTLVNEIIYQCIVDYSKGHAVHAGALSCQNRGILVPGKSGSGKSTLVAWLASKGLNYLSDELVFITENGTMLPFTRPVSLKSPDISLLDSFVDLEQGELINDPEGMMIPHRWINPDFRPDTPPVSLILFPHYQYGVETEITKLSSARACFQLMECHVNVRNIGGQWLGNLAGLAKQTAAYQVTYGCFDGLFELLQRLFTVR